MNYLPFLRAVALNACVFISAQSLSASHGGHMHSLSIELRNLQADKNSVSRSEAAGALAARLREIGPAAVSDSDMGLLCALLQSRDDALRFWGAVMIGDLGPRGKVAIPALKRALTDHPCSNKSVTSADAIRVALRKIGDQSTAPRC